MGTTGPVTMPTSPLSIVGEGEQIPAGAGAEGYTEDQLNTIVELATTRLINPALERLEEYWQEERQKEGG